MRGGFKVFEFPRFIEFLSFQVGVRDGWREGGPMRVLGTDHVILGQMKGLKKIMLPMAQTDRQTYRQTDIATL